MDYGYRIASVTACCCFFVALNTAFGSLYCDEVTVTPVKVVPLLAAANLLQLVSDPGLAGHII